MTVADVLKKAGVDFEEVLRKAGLSLEACEPGQLNGTEAELDFTSLPAHPIVVPSSGRVFFPIEYIRKYEALASSEFEWVEISKTRNLALVPTEHGRKLNKSRIIYLPVKIAEKYVGSYYLDRDGDMFILRQALL